MEGNTGIAIRFAICYRFTGLSCRIGASRLARTPNSWRTGRH